MCAINKCLGAPKRNVDYIVTRKFLKALYQKRPDLIPEEWVFRLDNAQVHTSEAFMAKTSMQLVPYPLFSPDLTPASLFLSTMVKRKLARLTFFLEEFKTKWEWIIRTLT